MASRSGSNGPRSPPPVLIRGDGRRRALGSRSTCSTRILISDSCRRQGFPALICMVWSGFSASTSESDLPQPFRTQSEPPSPKRNRIPAAFPIQLRVRIAVWRGENFFPNFQDAVGPNSDSGPLRMEQVQPGSAQEPTGSCINIRAAEINGRDWLRPAPPAPPFTVK